MRIVQDPPIPAFVKRLQRIDTYAEVDEIMKSPDFAMAGAPERTIFLEDSLIMSEGQRHSEQTRLFSPLMSRQAIAYYEKNLVIPAIEQGLSEMATQRSADGKVRVDAIPLLQAALTRISALVTGVDGVDTPERTERFRQLVMTLATATTGSFSESPVEQVLQAGRDALATLAKEYLEPSLARRVELVGRHRAGEIAKEDLPRDVLTSMALIDDLKHDDDDVKIPYVWRQCALFLTGSIKTTTHSLPHVLVHIDEWIKEHPEDKDKLTDPEWLHTAIAESFRLHQTSPCRFRAAVRDTTLSTGRKVAAGEMVAILAPPANLQTEMWGADARVFNPYRQIPAGIQHWGMSFGIGIHSCLGKNLVTGIQNRGDEKYGTHGTAVRFLKSLYDLGAEIDPENPPKRTPGTMNDTWENIILVLHKA